MNSSKRNENNFIWRNDDENFFFKRPQEVMIETTPCCNFNCVGCFNKASFANENRKHKIMSTEYIKKIIDDAARSKIPRIRFTGGETFLRKDLAELIEYTYQKGIKIWINTNATLVNPKIITKIQNYVEDVLIPINGYDPESDFRWTQTKDSFKNKIDGLRLLKESRIPVIRAGTVATSENITNLEKIYKIIKNNKLDYWEIYRPIPVTKDENKIDVSLLLKKLIRLSQDFGMQIPISNSIPLCSHEPDIMDRFCYGGKFDEGHSRIIVDARGFAKPSYFLDENIGDPRNIVRCWNHPLMKRLRNLEFLPEECKDVLL